MNHILSMVIKTALITVVMGSMAIGSIAHAEDRNTSGSLSKEEKEVILTVAAATKEKLLESVYKLVDKQFDSFLKEYTSDRKMTAVVNDVKKRIKQEIPSVAAELNAGFWCTITECLTDASASFDAVQAIYTNALREAYERAQKTADAYHAAAFVYVVKKAGAFTLQDQSKMIDGYRAFIDEQQKKIDAIPSLIDAEIANRIAKRKAEERKKAAENSLSAIFLPQKFEDEFKKRFEAGLLQDKDYQAGQRARAHIIDFINKLKSEIKDINSSFNNVQIAFNQMHQRLEKDELTTAAFDARILSVNKELDTIQKAMEKITQLLKNRRLQELKEQYGVDFNLAQKIIQFEQLAGQLKEERKALQSDAGKIALFRDVLEKGGDISQPFQPPRLSPPLDKPRQSPVQSSNNIPLLPIPPIPSIPNVPAAEMEEQARLSEAKNKRMRLIRANQFTIVYLAHTATIDMASKEEESRLNILKKTPGINVLVADIDAGFVTERICNGMQCPHGEIKIPSGLTASHVENPFIRRGVSASILVFTDGNLIGNFNREGSDGKKQMIEWLTKNVMVPQETPKSSTPPIKSSIPLLPIPPIPLIPLDRSADPFQSGPVETSPSPRTQTPPHIKPEIPKPTLFTDPPTCLPCRLLERDLNELFKDSNGKPYWKKYVIFGNPSDTPSGYIPCVTDPTDPHRLVEAKDCFKYLTDYIRKAEKQEKLERKQEEELKRKQEKGPASPAAIQAAQERLENSGDLSPEALRRIRKIFETRD